MWKDTTSYSRNEPLEERIPRTWEWRTTNLRIVLTRLHGADPTMWFMRCHDIGIDCLSLKSVLLEDAQEEAYGMVRDRLAWMLKELIDSRLASRESQKVTVDEASKERLKKAATKSSIVTPAPRKRR